MSKLYDAITKIEAAHNKREGIPEFRRKKPPYLLIALTLIVVAVFGISAFIITGKISEVNKNGVYTAGKLQRQNFQTAKTNIHKKISEQKLPLKTVEKTIRKRTVATGVNFRTDKKLVAVGAFQTREAKNLLKIAKIKKRIAKPGNRIRNVYITKRLTRKLDNTTAKPHNAINRVMLFRDIKSSNDFVAINAYKKLIRKYPNAMELDNNLAALYIEKGSYKNAIKLLKKILDVKNDINARLNLSIAYIKLREYKKARIMMGNLNTENNKEEMTAIKINSFLNNIHD